MTPLSEGKQPMTRTYTDEQVGEMTRQEMVEALQEMTCIAKLYPRHHQAAKQALSLLDAPEAEGWRPIETAPKDGTPIWGYDTFYEAQASVKWTNRGWELTDFYSDGYDAERDWDPDFWQPLPTPPAHGHREGE